jgi:hypothetical protein
MPPPNPFLKNPLTGLAAVTLMKVPDMVETHESRKPFKAWLAPRVPGGEPMPPAVVSRKGRTLVIHKGPEEGGDGDAPMMQ